MSYKVSGRVWKHSKQSGSTLLVLLALAEFADDGGVCWPSVAKLAEFARVSERATQYALRKLADDGEVTIEAGGGRHRLNRYTVQDMRHIPEDTEITTLDVIPSNESPKPIRMDTAGDMAHGLHPLNEDDPQETVQIPAETVQIATQRVQTATEKVQPVAPQPLERTVSQNRQEPHTASRRVSVPYLMVERMCTKLGRDPHALDPDFLKSQLGIAKRLGERGFTPDDIGDFMDYVLSQKRKWRDGLVNMQIVSKEIGTWEMNGKPLAEPDRARPRNSKPKPWEDDGLITPEKAAKYTWLSEQQAAS